VGIRAASARMAAATFRPSERSARLRPKAASSLSMVDPAGVRVVVAQGELVLLARHGQPSTRRTWPLTRARPPPRSSSRRVITSKVRQPAARCAGRTSPDPRPRRACQCYAAAGAATAGARQQLREHAVAQQVGHLEPVADRVQALERQIVRVIAAFAGERAQLMRAARRLSRTFCCCSSSICCGISSQRKRRSRTMGIMRKPMICPGDKAAARDSRSFCRRRNSSVGAWVR
jgi:hypothetical protein